MMLLFDDICAQVPTSYCFTNCLVVEYSLLIYNVLLDNITLMNVKYSTTFQS